MTRVITEAAGSGSRDSETSWEDEHPARDVAFAVTDRRCRALDIELVTRRGGSAASAGPT